jgi:hypothetical protein
MKNFAVIEDGVVTNIIISDSLENAQFGSGKLCIEYDENNLVHIGMSWNGENFA